MHKSLKLVNSDDSGSENDMLKFSPLNKIPNGKFKQKNIRDWLKKSDKNISNDRQVTVKKCLDFDDEKFQENSYTKVNKLKSKNPFVLLRRLGIEMIEGTNIIALEPANIFSSTSEEIKSLDSEDKFPNIITTRSRKKKTSPQAVSENKPTETENNDHKRKTRNKRMKLSDKNTKEKHDNDIILETNAANISSKISKDTHNVSVIKNPITCENAVISEQSKNIGNRRKKSSNVKIPSAIKDVEEERADVVNKPEKDTKKRRRSQRDFVSSTCSNESKTNNESTSTKKSSSIKMNEFSKLPKNKLKDDLFVNEEVGNASMALVPLFSPVTKRKHQKKILSGNEIFEPVHSTTKEYENLKTDIEMPAKKLKSEYYPPLKIEQIIQASTVNSSVENNSCHLQKTGKRVGRKRTTRKNISTVLPPKKNELLKTLTVSNDIPVSGNSELFAFYSDKLPSLIPASFQVENLCSNNLPASNLKDNEKPDKSKKQTECSEKSVQKQKLNRRCKMVVTDDSGNSDIVFQTIQNNIYTHAEVHKLEGSTDNLFLNPEKETIESLPNDDLNIMELKKDKISVISNYLPAECNSKNTNHNLLDNVKQEEEFTGIKDISHNEEIFKNNKNAKLCSPDCIISSTIKYKPEVNAKNEKFSEDIIYFLPVKSSKKNKQLKNFLPKPIGSLKQKSTKKSTPKTTEIKNACMHNSRTDNISQDNQVSSVDKEDLISKDDFKIDNDVQQEDLNDIKDSATNKEQFFSSCNSFYSPDCIVTSTLEYVPEVIDTSILECVPEVIFSDDSVSLHSKKCSKKKRQLKSDYPKCKDSVTRKTTRKSTRKFSEIKNTYMKDPEANNISQEDQVSSAEKENGMQQESFKEVEGSALNLEQSNSSVKNSYSSDSLTGALECVPEVGFRNNFSEDSISLHYKESSMSKKQLKSHLSKCKATLKQKSMKKSTRKSKEIKDTCIKDLETNNILQEDQISSADKENGMQQEGFKEAEGSALNTEQSNSSVKNSYSSDSLTGALECVPEVSFRNNFSEDSISLHYKKSSMSKKQLKSHLSKSKATLKQKSMKKSTRKSTEIKNTNINNPEVKKSQEDQVSFADEDNTISKNNLQTEIKNNMQQEDFKEVEDSAPNKEQSTSSITSTLECMPEVSFRNTNFSADSEYCHSRKSSKTKKHLKSNLFKSKQPLKQRSVKKSSRKSKEIKDICNKDSESNNILQDSQISSLDKENTIFKDDFQSEIDHDMQHKNLKEEKDSLSDKEQNSHPVENCPLDCITRSTIQCVTEVISKNDYFPDDTSFNSGSSLEKSKIPKNHMTKSKVLLKQNSTNTIAAICNEVKDNDIYNKDCKTNQEAHIPSVDIENIITNDLQAQIYNCTHQENLEVEDLTLEEKQNSSVYTEGLELQPLLVAVNLKDSENSNIVNSESTTSNNESTLNVENGMLGESQKFSKEAYFTLRKLLKDELGLNIRDILGMPEVIEGIKNSSSHYVMLLQSATTSSGVSKPKIQFSSNSDWEKMQKKH